MKANRKFIEADERAVSAVIGVILMVAITVAVAATVYVYVSGMINTTTNKAPHMAFNKQTTPYKGLVLVSADPGLKWADFTITGYNVTHSALGSNVVAGQFIYLADTGGVYATTITVVHTATNTLIGTYTWME